MVDPRIFVVENSESIGDTLYALMKHPSSEKNVSMDTIPVASLIQRYRPSILLIDLKTPALNGLTMMEFYKTTIWFNQAGVLAISGMTRKELGLELGFTGNNAFDKELITHELSGLMYSTSQLKQLVGC